MKRSKLSTIPRAAARMLLATLLLTAATQTACAETVNYLDASGSELSVDAIPVTFSDPDVQFVLGADGEETWYVVNSDTTLTQCLDINGDVHLILADNTTLSINNNNTGVPYGLYVCDNSSLTIYSQSLGSDMGKLVIDSHDDFYVGKNSQAIINGGDISVTTQAYAIYLDTNGNMTINNGTVSLTGKDTGVYNDEGTLTINNGTVSLTGTYYGVNNDNGSLTINGGTVTITGGAAISSRDNYSENGGTVTLNNTGEGGEPSGEGGGEETPDPITVSYLDALGNTQNVNAIPVTGSVLGADNKETWYVVNNDVDLTQCLYINGDVHLILADGKTLSINAEDYGVYMDNSSLTIYSQSLGSNMGKLVINSGWYWRVYKKSLTINGGNIDISSKIQHAVVSLDDGSSMTINNGTVSLKGSGYGVKNNEGTLTINGGTVTFDCQTSISNVANYTHKGGTVTLDCMVTFNSNGGSAVSGESVVFGQPVAEPASPTRDGYVFDCWMNGTEVYNFLEGIYTDLTLTAQWKKLMTNADITVSIPSQEWTGSELTFDPSAVVVKDGETTLTQNTDYTVTAPSGPIQDVGDYTYTITGMGNYSGEATATLTITPKTVTNSNITNTSSDATIMLTQDQNGTTATLDGASEGSVTITADVTVDDVKLGRTFNNGQKTAICWPFEVTASEAAGLGTFYEFKGINTEGKIEMQVVSTGLAANTPYIFEPKADITDAIDFGAKTLKAGGPASVGNGFTYKGIYRRVRWTTITSDPLYNADLANELGRAYGFALETKDDLNGKKTYSPGQFVMLGEGAHSRAFRAYMLYDGAWDGNAPSAAARRATRGMSLPNTIDIVWLTASGQTTGISTISPFSDSNTWYSLDGRRLSGKPTKKGLYIHNSKKVTIK